MGGKETELAGNSPYFGPQIQQVLVTGGGGFLGQALVAKLRQLGVSVRSFSRGSYPALEAMGATCVRGDLGDPQAVHQAVSGCQAVFHVAAKADAWGDPDLFERTNVLGTQHVLAACKSLGVRYLVHTSSPSVMPEDQNLEGVDESRPKATHFCADYPRTKALAEDLVQAACEGGDLFAVMLRPHLIYGPGDPQLLPRLMARYQAGRLRRVGNGSNKVDLTHIEDAVRAQICALNVLTCSEQSAQRVNGRAYFISSGEPVSLWEMVDKMLATQGAGPVQGSVPARVAEGVGACLEIWARWTRSNREPFMTRWLARKMSHAQWFDLSAAKRDLGYVPQVSNAQGLESLRQASASR